MKKEDRLYRIADCQQGYFTSRQALESGYYDSHFQRHIISGQWIRVRRGLYRLARYPMADRPDLVEWSFWSSNRKGEIQGVFSHQTALDSYDVCDVMPAKLHMTVPKNFHRAVAPPPVLIPTSAF
jgi:predicted transcriptional regulator of viral defense system